MPYVLRKTGGKVLRNFANAEQRVFLEERKVRVLQREALTLNSQIQDKKDELRDLEIDRGRKLLEFKGLPERKVKLTVKNKELEKEVAEKQEALEVQIEKKKELPRVIEKEVSIQKESLESLQGKVVEVSEEIAGLERMEQELKDFISEESDVLKRLPKEKVKLDEVIQKSESLNKELAEKKDFIKKRTKELDDYYEYVKDYSGKLTSNIHKVQQITKLMNQKLRRENILIRLELPVDKVEIPF